MKRFFLILLLPVLLLPFASFDKDGLVGHPIPLLPDKTLDGKTIDENYYKGHVTIVSFMFIGCPPCMNEISILNRMKKEYSADPRLQILCVARQMKEQMIAFNADNKKMFSQLRKAFNADPIEYSIQPACNDAKSNMDSTGSNVTLKSECNTIEEVYGVKAFPTNFFVDRNGIIRDIYTGGPTVKNDTTYYNNLKKKIDLLLKE